MEIAKSIVFQSKILNIKKMLGTLQTMGRDTSQIEIILNKIEQEQNDKINELKRLCNANEIMNDTFKESLEKIFQDSINLLDELQSKIQDEFAFYAKVMGIVDFIENNINKENISICIKETQRLLLSVKKASSVDDKVDEKLLELVYQVTYNLIKKELYFNHQSIILDFVALSDIDTSYLEKYILEEIDTLDLSALENQGIVNRLKIIQKAGLEANYLDLKLLTLLSIPRSKEELQTAKEQLLATVQESLEETKKEEGLVKEKNKIVAMVRQAKKDKLHSMKELLKSATTLTTYLAGSLTLGICSIAGINRLSKCNFYPTLEESYNITDSRNLPPQEYYEEEIKNPLQLVTYNTWEKRGFISQYFNRDILTYNLDAIEYENLSDYADIDLNSLGITPNTTTQTADTLTPEDLYETPYTLVKRYTQDKENPHLERIMPFPLEIYLDLVVMAIIIGIDVKIYEKIRDDYDLGLSRLIDEWSNLQEAKSKYKKLAQALSKTNKELEQLTILSKQLLLEIEQGYQQLPDFLWQDEDLTKALKKIKQANKS